MHLTSRLASLALLPVEVVLFFTLPVRAFLGVPYSFWTLLVSHWWIFQSHYFADRTRVQGTDLGVETVPAHSQQRAPQPPLPAQLSSVARLRAASEPSALLGAVRL